MVAADEFGLKAKGDKEKSKAEYLLLLEAFRNMLEVFGDYAEKWDCIEELVSLRVGFLFERVLDGLHLSFEEALERLRGRVDLSEKERQERDILVAAIDNLVDFATAQQYAVIRELPERIEEGDWDLYETICKKYNYVNAVRENQEVLYAALMAGWWLSVGEDERVSFRTQGDERVRPWHLSLEGMTFPKSSFPPEMIPPIEWGCRCYLVAEGGGKGDTPVSWNAVSGVDPVFRESLATGGKIFSGEHVYFGNSLPIEMKKISKEIKDKLYTP